MDNLKKPLNIIFLSLVCAVLLSGIFISGYYIGILSKESSADSNDFKIGYNSAINKLKQDGNVFIPQKISQISGIIKDVHDNFFTIQIDASNPIYKYTPQMRQINILPSSKIQKMIPKPEEDFQRELSLYNQKFIEFNQSQTENSNISAPEFPLRYDTFDLTLSDLKSNQQVFIETNDDVLYDENINAVVVNIAND